MCKSASEYCLRSEYREPLQVLSGILFTSLKKDSRSFVFTPLTAVMKFVGARLYAYEGDPRD